MDQPVMRALVMAPDDKAVEVLRALCQSVPAPSATALCLGQGNRPPGTGSALLRGRERRCELRRTVAALASTDSRVRVLVSRASRVSPDEAAEAALGGVSSPMFTVVATNWSSRRAATEHPAVNLATTVRTPARPECARRVSGPRTTRDRHPPLERTGTR